MKKHNIIALTEGWSLKMTGGTESYPAVVPGTVYETLLDNSVIPDPFYGMNEFDAKWVYENDWEYSMKLYAPEDMLNTEIVILRFKGLDTIVEVYFNDERILSGDNMHRTYDCYLKKPGKNILKSENSLRVVFKSPVAEARRRVEDMGFDIDDIGSHNFQIPGIETLRKAYYSFGWDWGPRIPDMGIWRAVELHTCNRMIEDLAIRTELTFSEPGMAEKAILKTELVLSEPLIPDDSASLTVQYTVRNKEKVVHESVAAISDRTLLSEIEVGSPVLWWTKELGTPELYEITASLIKDGEVIDVKTLKFGIREINLIRRADRWGETFYFELNGIPVFAKGVNWIPSDSLIVRGRRNRLHEKVIDDCLKANMNMIRVWGGGIYEDDEFYDYCDKMGILVWQDFTFACRPTPDFEGFEENVKREAEDNIRRLRNHPSLAIWVGNNEMEIGWVCWGFEKFVPELKQFYLRLFEEILPAYVKTFDGVRPYWPSSPSSGGNFNDPESENYGDSHYWKVWHEGYPLESYREFNSRFMSEFGFESFPDIKTIRAFCPEEQMAFDSEIMENHQKNPAGNKKIYDYMEKQFSIPQSFDKQIVLSQLSQAEAMQYGVEHWRQNRNDYHCMGALYWQVNDCWPVASWSSIDYYGRWKALHYVAKRFFNPLMISGLETDKDLEVWISNDLNEDFSGFYELSVLSTEGEVLYSKGEKIKVERLSSKGVKKVSLKEIKAVAEESIAFFKLYDNDKTLISEGFKLFCIPKKLNLKKPFFDYSLKRNGNSYEIAVSSTVPVIYCFIDIKESVCNDHMIFDDNYFSFDGTRKVIHFKSEKEMKPEDLIVRSLFEITRE